METGTFTTDSAGLVLLWPFLEKFFDRLELLEGANMQDPAARLKATRILNFVATREPNVPEDQLHLEKVLCGLDPSVPTQPILLADSDLQLIERLYEAVLQNWAALENSGADSLRNTFLLHPGLLTKVDTEWHLDVERMPYDLLLDRLPWQFSVIKTPWMPKPLTVNWNEAR